jgi:hypothetical protein
VRSKSVGALRAFAFVLTGILLSAGAAVAAARAVGDFGSLSGIARKPSDLAPRCYQVMWAHVDSLYAPAHIAFAPAHLPRMLFLETRPYRGPTVRSEPWFVLTLEDMDTDTLSLRSGVQFAGWKPAGSDSIDVRLELFPMTVRLRFAQAPAVGRARALIAWDTPGTERAVVQVTRVRCAPK